MELLNRIQHYFNTLEQKRFFQYMIGVLALISIGILLLLFYYYRSISHLKANIAQINETRTETREILDKAKQVAKERTQIDALLAQDEHFKILDVFEKMVGKLGLSNNKSSTEISSPIREGDYQETILQAKFVGLTMKNLTELLQEIEFNKRIFTKDLTITASTKQPGTINVTLTIVTIEQKPKETSESFGVYNE